MNKLKAYMIDHKGLRLISWILIFSLVGFFIYYCLTPFINFNKGSSLTLNDLNNNIYINSTSTSYLTFESNSCVKSDVNDDFISSKKYSVSLNNGYLTLKKDEETINYLLYGNYAIWNLSDNIIFERI